MITVVETEEFLAGMEAILSEDEDDAPHFVLQISMFRCF
jgi:hypothetical protein